MAVAFDVKQTTWAIVSNGTSFSYTPTLSASISASATLMLVFVVSTTTFSSPSLHYNSVAMTQVGSLTGATGGPFVAMFALLNPTTGAAHTLTGSWTGTVTEMEVLCATFTGTSTASIAACIPSGDIVTSTATDSAAIYPPSSGFSINSANGDAVAGVAGTSGGGLLSMHVGTLLVANNANTDNSIAGYSLSSGSSTVLSFTGNSDSAASAAMGVHIAAPAAAATNFSLNNFFDAVVKPKTAAPVELAFSFGQGPFAGTSPALSSPYVQAPFFEPVRLKRPSEFGPGPFAQTSPALVSPYVQAPFFEPTQLKRPQVEAPPVMMPAIAANYFIQNFFDPTKLKQPQVEAPPIMMPQIFIQNYVTSAFFDPTKLKRPIIDIPDNVTIPPAVQTFVTQQPFFEPILLKRPQVEAPYIIPGTSPALSSPRSFDLWFEPTRLKQPIINIPDIVPPLAVAAQYSLSNWFEVTRLLKVVDRFLEAFGVPFPPPILETGPWFDVLRKLLVAEGFNWTQATAQANTVLYAITDWFDRTILKQPLVETPGIYFYPPQVIPPTPPVLPPVTEQFRRGGQWDPENWYNRSEEAVRKEIRRAILKAMGKDVGEAQASRVAAELANSAANPHLESLMPGHEAEYLGHFMRANVHAVHAAIDRVEAQERDDEEAILAYDKFTEEAILRLKGLL